MAIGSIISVVIFFWVHYQEQSTEDFYFNRRAHFRVVFIEQGLVSATDALQVVNRLFVANSAVTREQFHTFTQPLLERHPYIQALSFHRLVSQAERPAYEAGMRTRFPDFSIDEIIDGRRVPAASRDSYRVVDYIEPLKDNEAWFGLDAASASFPGNTAQKNPDTGRPSATGLFPIAGDDNAQRGFRIMMPVYASRALGGDAGFARPPVIGYTEIILRTKDFFEKLLTPAGTQPNNGMQIQIYATASADPRMLAYGDAEAPAGDAGNFLPAWLFRDEPEVFSRTVKVADSMWRVVISPKHQPFAIAHSDTLFAFLVALFSTFAATALVQSMLLRSQRIQQLVATRTLELKQTNELLNEDIKARRKAEQALIKSEERSRHLANLSSDWFWEQDEQFRFTTVSSGIAKRGGIPAQMLLGATPWELPVDQDASDWNAHRAILNAHQPFRNFEFKVTYADQNQWFSTSGEPLFHANGEFKGYRGTTRDISESKRVDEALRQSRTMLRELADHQENIKEDERKRIAREIHDELGQNLMALRIDISMMNTGSNAHGVNPEQISAALKQVDTTIKAVREIINDLRPAVLDLGLHAAIEWQIKEFERRHGIACELLIDHEEFELDDRRATALFRIVQESLANIVRHAMASKVWIEMRQDDGSLYMKISDNGVGLFPDCRRKANAFGLVGIAERINALGGTLRILSNPGQGMAIMISIRIECDEHQAGYDETTASAHLHGNVVKQIERRHIISR